jgi:hypothetical protein
MHIEAEMVACALIEMKLRGRKSAIDIVALKRDRQL